MTGEIIWFFILMWIIATAAFAPLGYFIYMYTKKSGRPFGETEPHGDSSSVINDFAENVIAFGKNLLKKLGA